MQATIGTYKYYVDQLESDQFFFETSCGRNLAITVGKDYEAQDIATDLDTNEKVKLSSLMGVDGLRVADAAWNFNFPVENKDD